jgi:hypothetical protein
MDKTHVFLLLILVLISGALASYNIYQVLNLEGLENKNEDEDISDIGKKLQKLLTNKMEQMKSSDKKEEGKKEEKKEKIEGFELYGASYNDNSYKPELFSSLDGNCNDNVRFPYTNSKGYLCMTDEAVRLLTTRGGNAV